ncbi:MAG: alpha/beta hydrolase [Clostridia bacterium]|nr:alpha/beta hydrolase [Clostridia bacterium]
MRFQTEHLFDDPETYLNVYLHDRLSGVRADPRPAMLIFPGGGYWGCCHREGEPIALYFLQAGFNVFVLYYSVGPKATEYKPIIQAALTVKHIRENAGRYHIRPDQVFVTGFSAGGHLAATTGTLFDAPPVKKALEGAPDGISIPDGMILSYAVLCGTKWAHKGSIDALLGDPDAPDSLREQFALDKHVSDRTPPTFLWHTSTDDCVPVMNSLLFAEQLYQHHVPFAMRIYPVGPHGLATGDRETNDGVSECREWMEQAAKWALDICTGKN